jgi:hypothetical protein
MSRMKLDEEAALAIGHALHAVNRRARHTDIGVRTLSVRGRDFILEWDDEAHAYVVTGEYAAG